jgi:putative oxidoreductase
VDLRPPVEVVRENERKTMRVFAKGAQDVALLIARLAMAVIVFVHGWVRVAGPGGVDFYADRLAVAGLPWPTVFAWGTVILELAGGVLLAFGILTRIVAAVFVAEFVMTILWLRWNFGFFVGEGGYEYAGLMAVLNLIFVAFGGGSLAVDRLFRRKGSEDDRAGVIL